MPPKKSSLRFISALLLVASGVAAQAQDRTTPPAKDSNVVTLDKLVVQSAATPTANTLADKRQIALQAPAASVIQAIKYIPGVNLSQGDAFGGDDWSTRLSIRGFTEGQLGWTVDDVTTGYTAYGGGAKPNRFIDIENLASVSVSQGATDLRSSSTQALGGTLAYFTDAPANDFGVASKFSFGSFNTQRGFVRVDTGSFANNSSKAFVSFSSEQNDNWVGHYVGGDAALTKRLHFNAKDVTKLGAAKLTAYASIDNVNPEINFQGISTTQFAIDSRNDLLTFTFTGKPNPDQNYAPTWTTIRTNSLVYLKLEGEAAPGLQYSLQPYWAHQQGKGQFLPPYQVRRFDLAGNPTALGNYLPASKAAFNRVFFASGGVDIAPANPTTGAAAADPFNIATYTWLTPAQQAAAKPLSSARFSRYLNNRYGGNLGFGYKLNEQNQLSFGLWSELQRRQRYRTWHAVLDPTVSAAYNQGAYLKSFHWHYRTATNMFYAQDQFTAGPLTVTGGVKYFNITFKGNESLLQSDGTTYAKSLDSNSSVLPTLGAVYRIDAENQIFGGITRNFSAVKDNIFSDNVTVGSTDYSRVKPEKADNFDVGYRYSSRDLALSATAFYIKYTDKIVALSGTAAKDYTNTAGSVLANIGGTESYGVEVAANYRLGSGFSFLGTLSSTNAKYTSTTPDGTITKDKKVVDTPSGIASYGLLYGRDGLSAGLIGKTTGKLYGTYNNDNYAKAYTTVDFSFDYTRRFRGGDFIRSVTFGLNVANVLDKSYLGAVSIYDQGYVKSDPTGTTMLYNIGAPRTLTFTVGLGF
jgi:iron complex outermembrane receptor protein